MYKVGDRVVYINKESLCSFNTGFDIDIIEGSSGVVYEIIPGNDNQLKVNFDKSGKCPGLYEYKFVLEEIYNSPLYQVLKEEL